jgi:precorrin-2/cobalt-factor-2 C20-methyltransferase
MSTPESGASPGTLYGIGVGPGDPELIPLKAIRIIQEADVIFTACSTKNDYSMAVRVARPHIPENADVRQLPFPMTMDREVVRRAWREHAGTVIRELEKGSSAAFLTLGDPLTYSTFGYLLRNIRSQAPHLRVETVPGITSYQAAAAATNTPLVEGEESLLLLSGVNGGGGLRAMADASDNVVFLKAYKNMDDIARTLGETGRLDSSVGVVRCCFPEQEIFRDVRELCRRRPRYWTLIISKRKESDEEQG